MAYVKLLYPNNYIMNGKPIQVALQDPKYDYMQPHKILHVNIMLFHYK